MDKFGSPEIGDATGEKEQLVEEVSDSILGDLFELGPEVLNRGLGSTPKTKDQRVAEWMRRDETYWPERYQDLIARGASPERAELELLRHAKKLMEEDSGSA